MSVKVAISDTYRPQFVGAAYWVKGLIYRLRIKETIDDLLPDQPEAATTYGRLAQVVVANRMTLQACPLYKLGAWAAQHGRDPVFGVSAEPWDDDRLGAMLDPLADPPVDIWTRVIRTAQKRFEWDLRGLHEDTTSVDFEGAYTDAEGQPLPGGDRIPRRVEGDHKDGQRNKVQWVLSRRVSGRVPLFYRMWDGNPADDGVDLADGTDVQRLLLAPKNAVLVGDRKLNSHATRLSLCQAGHQFLGAHPWTDTAQAAWQTVGGPLELGQRQWPPAPYVSRAHARKPAAERPTDRVCDIPQEVLDEDTGTGYPVRWVFCGSSEKATRDAQSRAKAIQTADTALRRLAPLLGKYKNKPRTVIDARLVQILEQAKATPYLTDHLRGTDADQAWHLTWDVDAAAIADATRRDGVMLLCTNVPVGDLSAADAMAKYKEQVQVEPGIDFIQSPVQIRPMWLHQPRRLAGLTLWIMLAVLTAMLLEAQVRRWIAKHDPPLKDLRPEKRGDAYPTATALLRVFAPYAVVRVQGRRGREELHWPSLTPLQKKIWTISGYRTELTQDKSDGRYPGGGDSSTDGRRGLFEVGSLYERLRVLRDVRKPRGGATRWLPCCWAGFSRSGPDKTVRRRWRMGCACEKRPIEVCCR